ncbi:MAG: MBL fold metallo-hydrolase [Sphaerochaetaceae bacterium]|jgi:7,8-dihydropterin-6-yl-methyl-4-(beta-D-ribofuranosyl)aminobenzene 5'-phosphate synthase|nr:MBL fold metallo-hydrolase [Sphaerochaetaceae bacterium]
MKITALVENTSHKDMIGSEHGLSLLIETERKTLLLDTGASDLFAHNAKTLGVDLNLVDLAILSHGHYDHAGGIKTFFEHNDHAPLYVRQKAFGLHYSKTGPDEYKYIGIDQDLLDSNRLVVTSPFTSLCPGHTLFSMASGNVLAPSDNKRLFCKENDQYTQDSFKHEQYIVIFKPGIRLLVSGCSHKGIINILQAYHDLWGDYPTHVIGGFHLYNHRTGESEGPEVLATIASELLASKAIFYTCHCTGEDSFKALQMLMGDKIKYLAGGDILQLP